jgi:hypothetical protein
MEDSAFCHPEKKAAEAEEEFRKSENPNVVSLRLLIHPLDFREFYFSQTRESLDRSPDAFAFFLSNGIEPSKQYLGSSIICYHIRSRFLSIASS